MISNEARERVQAVLAIARRIVDASDALGVEARTELRRTSGLSDEGVELALATSLETSATDAELARLASWAGAATRCHVVLSANVCTAAVRALALALAATSAVVLKPSRRDGGLAPLLVRELQANGGLNIRESASLSATPGDDVHAYGSDVTLRAIAEGLPEGVRLRGHGAGFGVAMVHRDAAREDADLEGAAEKLADDVVVFDQQGCVSPRIVFVEGAAAARIFARALDQALTTRASSVPVGRAVREQRREARVYAQTMSAVGLVFEKDDHVVTLDDDPQAIVLPPAARALAVLAVGSEAHAATLLGPLSPFVTAIGTMQGSNAASGPLSIRCRGARSSRLGSMQRLPLDGPVDLRPARG